MYLWQKHLKLKTREQEQGVFGCSLTISSLNNVQSLTGVDPEILKRGDILCRPTWLADEKNFSFQMVKNDAKISKGEVGNGK